MPEELPPKQLLAPKKRIGLKVFLATLVVVLVGVIGYIALFFIPQDKAPGKLVIDTYNKELDISDWQTYRNEEYGFEFQYPPSFYFKDSNNDVFPVLCEQGKDSSKYCVSIWTLVDSKSLFSYKDYKDFAIKTVKLFCDADGPTGSRFCDSITHIEKLDLDNNIEGYKLVLNEVSQTVGGQTLSENQKGPLYILKIDDIPRDFVSLYFEPYQESPTDYSSVIEEIIKTVKFIEPSTTIHWQTYRNEEFGFEIRYPLNATLKELEPITEGDLGISKRLFAISINQENSTAFLAVRDYNSSNNWCTSDGSEKGEFLVVDGQRLQKCLKPDFGGVKPVSYGLFLGQKGTYYYDFSCSKTESSECDEIISTFKFFEPVDTSGWQIYINDFFGIELMYPGDHTVWDEILALTYSSGEVEHTLSPADKNSQKFNFTEDEKNLFCCEALTIEIFASDKNLTIQEWLEQNLKTYTSESEIKSKKQIDFFGRNAVEIIAGSNIGSTYKLLVIDDNKRLIIINQNSKIDLLNVVFSTIKFIN